MAAVQTMSAGVGSGSGEKRRTKSGAISRNQRGQHFLLSPASRTLSFDKVSKLSEEEAHALFMKVRWPETNGEPVCPDCGCAAAYRHKTRPRLFTCQSCNKQYTVTSGTIFHSTKLSFVKILSVIFLYVNESAGLCAVKLIGLVSMSYKTAFALIHKIREAVGSDSKGKTASGEVEVDGAYVGGHVRPHNQKEKRVNRSLAKNKSGKRRSVIVIRERGGRTLPFVSLSEADAVPEIIRRIHPDALVYTDEAPSWNELQHSGLDRLTVNHKECYNNGEACTNNAEGFFSRMRRAEHGIHIHISGQHLENYAVDVAWKEDARRIPNGTKYLLALHAALRHPPSLKWCGYQEHGGRGSRQPN